MSDYDESIAYLERLAASPLQNVPGASLLRAERLLAQAGDPHHRFATLHVSGSSGKGSTSAMAAAMLQAAGYRVGLFSSPHLQDYTERIAVDGTPIAPGDWVRLLNGLRPTVDAMAGGTLPGYTLGRPALLQVLWPLAALYFAERGVEISVVEVGMGGRYDSTNVNNARVAVITNVTLEHTAVLGATTAAIAEHKAGVAKPGGTLVTAATDRDALAVIAAECARQGTTLWRVTAVDGDGEVRVDGNAETLHVRTPTASHEGLRLAMRGRHQIMNAACAVAAVDALAEQTVACVPPDAVRAGLAAARVPGRMEQVAGDPPIWLDGAHNADAARTLAAALREVLPGRRPVLLLGILGDKDIAAMVGALAPLAAAVVVTEPPWAGRMGHSGVVACAAREITPAVVVEPDVRRALEMARQQARESGEPLVVAGSLILVGEVRRLLASMT